MEIEFSGMYDKSLYFKAVRWVCQPTRRQWIVRISYFTLILFLYVAALIGASKENFSVFEISRLIRHLVSLFILGYIVIQPFITAYQSANKLWGDPAIRQRVTGRISSMGIQVDPSNELIPWEKYYRANQTTEMLVLYGVSSFICLQRDFFQSDSDWKRFQNLVSSRVKDVKQ